jgi:uncharacterized phiE125 gp8 family phage protein
MRVVVVTPPEPVIIQEEAAQHLRLGDSVDEYQLLESITAAATAHIDGPDGWLGRAIGVQTLEAYLPSFGQTSIRLPYPPAIDVVSIDYVDQAGESVTLDEAGYELTGNLLRPAWPNPWPTAQWRGCEGEPVRIRYRAGYEELPAPIRAAILLMIGDLFEYRETAVSGSISAIPMSTTVERLLSPFRVWA